MRRVDHLLNVSIHDCCLNLLRGSSDLHATTFEKTLAMPTWQRHINVWFLVRKSMKPAHQIVKKGESNLNRSMVLRKNVA